MEVPSDLIAQFMGVTNAPEALATQLLRDSGLNLETAISSFFAIQEVGGLPTSSSPNPSTPPSPPPTVREPIPQIVDTLLPSTAPPPSAPAPPQPFENAGGSARGDRLATMYRAPNHLNFSGVLDEAMRAGVRQKKWLLISLQRSDVFSSLLLNRDVWSQGDVEEVVAAHFILWQRDERTDQGSRYKQFYPYQQVPHLAIIDPRSGERVRTWGGTGNAIDKDDILTKLVDFAQNHSLDSDASVRPVRGASTFGDVNRIPEEDTPMPMDEDHQLAAAIAASMEEGGADPESHTHQEQNGIGAGGDYDERAASRLLSATDPTLNRQRSLRAQQDSAFEESLAMDRAIAQSEQMERERQEREAAEKVRKQREAEMKRTAKRTRVPAVPPPDCKEKTTELMIRMPTGARVQRKFLASNTVGNVYDFIESEVDELADVNFELMAAYPRKSYTDREASLEELAPKAALVVHLKD